MTGLADLASLQRQMAPQLHPPIYVYCCFKDFVVPDGMEPICTFREREGLTVIVEEAQAEHCGAAFVFKARQITLTVHSSLDAVGFLAMLSSQLARAGIPCNVVAGFHHDHLFVPVDRATEALALLNELAGA